MIIERSLGVLGAWLLCAAVPVQAQQPVQVQDPAPGPAPSLAPLPPPVQDNSAIGPPQLRDFRLQPQRRIVAQPQPNTPPVVLRPPPPAGVQPRAAPQTTPSLPAPQAPVATRPTPTPPAAAPSTAPLSETPVAPAPPIAAPVAPPPASDASPFSSYWPLAVPLALLALLGLALFRGRRRREAVAYAEAPAAQPVTAPPPVQPPAPAPAPRTTPAPRPWLELEFKTERATFTATEAVVEFELAVLNNGDSAARNLRIDVKMFNAGREQDREIGSFFRTAGRQSTRLNLPGLAAKSTGVIPAQVAMPVDEMRAVQLEDRMLFVPVVAVNILYEWGEGLMGQTSKSYVIGRELQQPSEKMGAFRVDQGPRIWRTVGQRQHNLERRV